MTTPWNLRAAQRMERVGSSMIRELLKLAQRPEVISFAGGLPAAELFPIAEVDEAASRVLQEHGSNALQYSTTEGYPPLREYLANKLAAQGLPVTADNVLITSGAQQALDIVGRVLLNPGDYVLTERPTFLGALQAWRSYQANFVSAPVDDDGVCTHELEDVMTCAPKFMYALPNFQNPSGVTMTLERRLALVDIADRYGMPIVEDDPYGDLRFEGEGLPPLIVLDQERFGRSASGLTQGNVIYVGTFSKTLAPGFRLGWMVAPTSMIQMGVKAKQGMDLHTSTFNQMIAYELVRDGFIDRHVRRIQAAYRERRDVTLAAMEAHFPYGVRWTQPKGGLFLWVTLPESIDTAVLLETAVAQQHVAFVPGFTFYPDGSGRNTMRLNFSSAHPEQIEIGMERLGRVLHQAMETVRVKNGTAVSVK